MAMVAPSLGSVIRTPSNASSPYIHSYPPGVSSASLAAQLSLPVKGSLPRRLDASNMSPMILPVQSPISSAYPATSASSRTVEGPAVFKSGTQGGYVCPCGNKLAPADKFCTRCGKQRPVVLPQTVEGRLASESFITGDVPAPFEAQSVLLQPPEGVPEVLYQGAEAAENAEAHAVPDTLLERQLELEASMDGIEDYHKPKKIQAEVKGQHLSSQPGWNRREWSHDPFYGWRTQMDSKIAPVPKEKMVSEARRRAAIQARENRAHLLASGVGMDIREDPFMVKEGSRPRPLDQPRKLDILTDDGASLAVRDPMDQATIAQLSKPGHVGPSWHDAETKERILAASHMSGNWLAQPDAIKQRAIIEYDLPVHAFVGDAPERAGSLGLPLPSAPPPLPPPSLPPGSDSDIFGTDSSEHAKSWTSLFSLNRSEPRRPAGSKASTASTDRARFDPFDANQERPLNVGPSFKPPPGPLWFLGM